MDALKKLARWVLREELKRRDRVLKDCQEAFLAACDDRAAARRETRRVWDSRDELLDRVSKMREWGAENGDTTALAWSDHITQLHSGPGSFGIVHPFDRWGVSPKP